VQTIEGAAFSAHENPLVRALRGETVSGVTASLPDGDGKRRWVSVSAAPTRGRDGHLGGAVAALSDLGRIQELQAQREDLLRAVSHDLRNPLQIVLLQAERLQRLLRDPARETERTASERIARAAKQMGVMIRDLVEAARMESGGLPLSRQAVELHPLAQRLLAQAAGVLDVGRVAVAVAPEVPCVDADPARVERVLLNLVANALKYSPEGSGVRIDAVLRGPEVQVAVQNSGPGIDPEDLPRLFERFYRGRRSQRHDGLGLGLYIVQVMVQAHGGRVWVDSRPGEGATFTFTLPVWKGSSARSR